MDQYGNLTNQITAWGLQTTGGFAGSGGGLSAYFSMPAWQQGLPGTQGLMRNQPDLSLEADGATGVAVVMDSGTGMGGPGVAQYGGTSVAAPEMAAMWALVLQACKSNPSCAKGTGAFPYRLGNPSALLYSLYYKNGAIAPTYASTFYDVLYGSNAQAVQSPGPTPVPAGAYDAGYNAGPGYDLVTGLGVPFARALIHSVAGV
jgi:kumamolisin